MADGIERLIIEALEELEEPRDAARRARPLPHGHHILEQYAALCREDEPEDADRAPNVALPIAPATGRESARPEPVEGRAAAAGPSRASHIATLAQRVLARVKPRG